MPFLLSSQNVFAYLKQHNLWTQEEADPSQIEPKVAKNFNLLLSLSDGRKLLVKQERYIGEGKTAGEFLNEWRIQEFLQQFPALSYLRSSLPEVLHFDAKNSIIVFNYLTDYRDLADFYAKEKVFPTAIASAMGVVLAAIHRATLNHLEYQDFFSQEGEDVSVNRMININRDLQRISPEVFGRVSADGLKFFALYQRYDSLKQAIAELAAAFNPCCVTHNDLKLNNILLHNDWEQRLSVQPSDTSIVRLIDWERCTWGDPAFDLGMLIGSYLQIWLSSLVVSKSIEIEESLRMAMTPLEKLQPSMAALIGTYLSNFPEILECDPNFLQKVMQSSGLALIIRIQAMLQHQKSFGGNTGICMLQVAKGLLCRPKQSISTVLGAAASEIAGLNLSLV